MRFQRFKHESGQHGTLTDNRINSIHVDQHGVIWAATQNGLNRFDPATGLFSSYFETDGLASSAVSWYPGDSSGDLWMGTNNGISRLNHETAPSRIIQSLTACRVQILRDGVTASRARAARCSSVGLPELLHFTRRCQRQCVYAAAGPDGVRSLRNARPPGPHSPLERAIGYTDAVTLSYAQNTFSFEFSALSFRSYNQSLPLHARGPGCELARGRSDRRLASYTTLRRVFIRFACKVRQAEARGASLAQRCE